MRALADVRVLIPDDELVLSSLSAVANRFKITIGRFPLERTPVASMYSRLKCKGFLEGLKGLSMEDVVYFVDADTYCNNNISPNNSTKVRLLSGKIAFVPDVKDRHSRNPKRAWYLDDKKRLRYVNSGVITASIKALDIFEKFYRLSLDPGFTGGPFHDQLIINFALGEFFPDRLILLEKKFNNMGEEYDHKSIIGHCAGGMGGYRDSHTRCARHEYICSNIIRSKLKIAVS